MMIMESDHDLALQLNFRNNIPILQLGSSLQ